MDEWGKKRKMWKLFYLINIKKKSTIWGFVDLSSSIPNLVASKMIDFDRNYQQTNGQRFSFIYTRTGQMNNN